MKISATSKLTGTALLAALVVVIDYALKFSGLKIPFPLLPMLKFDFTRIPIVLSLMMYGLPSALTTSLVAFVAIIARSGDVIGALMKFAAEFSTVLGLALGLRLTRLTPWLQKGLGLSLGILLRVVVTSLASVPVFQVFYAYTVSRIYYLLPFIAAFNIAQGAITVLLGLFLYKAINKRFPTPRS